MTSQIESKRTLEMFNFSYPASIVHPKLGQYAVFNVTVFKVKVVKFDPVQIAACSVK
jgi:hypothetical protein